MKDRIDDGQRNADISEIDEVTALTIQKQEEVKEKQLVDLLIKFFVRITLKEYYEKKSDQIPSVQQEQTKQRID